MTDKLTKEEWDRLERSGYLDYGRKLTDEQDLAKQRDEIRRLAEQRRKLRADLTPQELFRLEHYGWIDFESAGATRKR